MNKIKTVIEYFQEKLNKIYNLSKLNNKNGNSMENKKKYY
jgi:hypothetical protein